MPVKPYTEVEKKQIIQAYSQVLRILKKKFPEENTKMIRQAFDIAAEAHRGTFRQSGEPYILHPIAVARILIEEIGLGSISVICALLHDTVEDTFVNLEDIEKIFGSKISKIINGLTKITHTEEVNKIEKEADNLKKMMITLASDIRVIFIKLADRLHNMRTLGSMDTEKKRRISLETMHIYIPFAHRLGLYAIKSELEDLAFMHLDPERFQEISHQIKNTHTVRARFLNQFSLPIRQALEENNIPYLIKYRPKSVYAIYKKMRRTNLKFAEIFDLNGIRIVLETSPEREKLDCWRVYTLITEIYKPNMDRFRDWITVPRSNGYESLHTTVMSPKGKWVEIQIRSKRMDDIAEKGIASHWKYKEDQDNINFFDPNFGEWLAKAKELIVESRNVSSLELVNEFKRSLLTAEITTFTPKGDPIVLPKGASVLDFAFSIHSQVAQRCIGAKIDHQLYPITYILQEGNQVEIITSDISSIQENWLDIVVSHKAKLMVKQILRQKRKNFEQLGRKKLLQFFLVQNIPYSAEQLRQVLIFFEYNSNTELYYHVASNDINLHLILQHINHKQQIELPKSEILNKEKGGIFNYENYQLAIEFKNYNRFQWIELLNLFKTKKDIEINYFQYIAQEKKLHIHFLMPEKYFQALWMELSGLEDIKRIEDLKR